MPAAHTPHGVVEPVKLRCLPGAHSSHAPIAVSGPNEPGAHGEPAPPAPRSVTGYHDTSTALRELCSASFDVAAFPSVGESGTDLEGAKPCAWCVRVRRCGHGQ